MTVSIRASGDSAPTVVHVPDLAIGAPGLETDAQRAVQFVRSTPGVGAALVGMQRLAHVEENARLGRVPPLAWSRFQRLFQGEESA